MSESYTLNPKTELRHRWLTWLVLLCATLISLGAYLIASKNHIRTGFPLDDAWIHQTYARNLGVRGEWTFIPGQPSGGSTSPLWTALLVPGYWMGLSPFGWTFMLGGILLFCLAGLTEYGLGFLLEGYHSKIPLAGLLVIFEWHFTWSAVSGMETILQAVIFLLSACLLLRQRPPWVVMGFLVGVSTWVRPDGITLFGPVIFTALLIGKSWKDRLRAILAASVGIILLLLPYLYFNYSLTGRILPTTFYAKQAEYATWQATSVFRRTSEVLQSFLTGSAILLLPGFLLQVKNGLRKKNWGLIAMIAWMIGYLAIYMLRLPAYQHGRYLIPAMPIYFYFSLGAVLLFMRKEQAERKILKSLKFAWGAMITFTCLGFWILGMKAYQQDVEFVETEMVDTARWVSETIPEGAILAAHDIGALGYFDQHKLIDLAGLITPEVLPFLLDEERLRGFLDLQEVDYLIVFPDWYPSLISNREEVFTTGAVYAPSVGGTNMTVYLWQER